MRLSPLKLKQASVLLGISRKELQNLVQFGVIRPRRRSSVFWFSEKELLQAKVADYLKKSLGISTYYLAIITEELAKHPESWYRGYLLMQICGAKGMPVMELTIPLEELRKQLERQFPAALAAMDLPKGRRRKGWTKEMRETLSQIGKDLAELNDAEIRRAVRGVRERRSRVNKPKITLAQ